MKRYYKFAFYATTALALWLLYDLIFNNWCDFSNEAEALRTAQLLFTEMNFDHKLAGNDADVSFDAFHFTLNEFTPASETNPQSASVNVIFDGAPNETWRMEFGSGCIGAVRFEKLTEEVN